MTLSVRTRFEVLKRDRFTCSYCGKHPPEVLLEVDHIHPLAAGGTDDLENLTTACTDCNRGKGARMLEEGTAPAVNASAIAEMQERIEQAKAYMESLGALRSITDQQVQRVIDAWAEAFDATLKETEDGTYWTFEQNIYGGHWPDARSIRSFLRKLPLEAVLDAVDITRGRMHGPASGAVRYFYGVCHTAIRNRREVPTPETETVGLADMYTEGRNDGKEMGAYLEHRRLGEILRNHQEHGYETLEAAVMALWPDPD